MTENKPTATESGMPISNTCRDITGIGVCKCWRIPDDDGPTEIERYAQQQRERAEKAETEIERRDDFRGCDGCSTGDCPHDTVQECSDAQAEIIQEQEAALHKTQDERDAALAENARLREVVHGAVLKIQDGSAIHAEGMLSDAIAETGESND